MQIRISNIDWDTDGTPVDTLGLPQAVTLDARAEGIDDPETELADWLSDRYGWCVNSFAFTAAGPA